MSEKRITELEIRFAHQDEFINQLNEIVVDQQKAIERLEKAVLDLRRNTSLDALEGGPRNLSDEKPPHY